MVLRITIDVFSGRPNPVIEIDGKQAREFLERIRPAKPLRKRAMPVPEFRLGYRGLIIEQTGPASRALPTVVRVAAGAIFLRDVMPIDQVLLLYEPFAAAFPYESLQ